MIECSAPAGFSALSQKGVHWFQTNQKYAGPAKVSLGGPAHARALIQPFDKTPLTAVGNSRKHAKLLSVSSNGPESKQAATILSQPAATVVFGCQGGSTLQQLEPEREHSLVSPPLLSPSPPPHPASERAGQ